MASQTSGRTGRSGATTATTATTTAKPTANDAATETASPPQPRRPEPSQRVGVDVNLVTVQTAFATRDASQSVGFVQHMLRSRGFEPGNFAGIADDETRTAYARYQDSVGERPTGLPTAFSLDYLGFDVVG
jgi:hypothetical protein